MIPFVKSWNYVILLVVKTRRELVMHWTLHRWLWSRLGWLCQGRQGLRSQQITEIHLSYTPLRSMISANRRTSIEETIWRHLYTVITGKQTGPSLHLCRNAIRYHMQICPQRGVLPPLLWNFVVDKLLVLWWWHQHNQVGKIFANNFIAPSRLCCKCHPWTSWWNEQRNS